MSVKFVSDFLLEDSPGGAEHVDDTVITALGLEAVRSRDFTPNEEDFYIISNISLLPQSSIDYLAAKCKYIILEHDYKFHPTRHPWRYPNNIVDSGELINLSLYENAIMTFVQTDDHLEVFKLNNIKGNFESLNCSIWSTEELDNLVDLHRLSRLKESSFAIINSENWIKNTKQAVEFCHSMKITYELIESQDYNRFLRSLSRYSALVFFPIARETCCRLLVEAKCLGLNVITSQNSGAFQADWFRLNGTDLISYLREQSLKNLRSIEGLLNENKN
tara:strand:- start:9645 stop:10472 length:828 start_codon:yes stop_codon:yes gene_type:complete